MILECTSFETCPCKACKKHTIMDLAINVEAFQVHCIGQYSECRVIHRFKDLAVSPPFDTNLSQRSAVLRPDVSAKRMKSGCIFNGKGVVAI